MSFSSPWYFSFTAAVFASWSASITANSASLALSKLDKSTFAGTGALPPGSPGSFPKPGFVGFGPAPSFTMRFFERIGPRLDNEETGVIYSYEINNVNYTRYDYPRVLPDENTTHIQFTVLSLVNALVAVSTAILICTFYNSNLFPIVS